MRLSTFSALRRDLEQAGISLPLQFKLLKAVEFQPVAGEPIAAANHRIGFQRAIQENCQPRM
jgi:hypothetical protein